MNGMTDTDYFPVFGYGLLIPEQYVNEFIDRYAVVHDVNYAHCDYQALHTYDFIDMLDSIKLHALRITTDYFNLVTLYPLSSYSVFADYLHPYDSNAVVEDYNHHTGNSFFNPYEENSIFIYADRQGTLFKDSEVSTNGPVMYDSLDELVQEFSDKYGDYLPADFDIKPHLCFLAGATTVC